MGKNKYKYILGQVYWGVRFADGILDYEKARVCRYPDDSLYLKTTHIEINDEKIDYDDVIGDSFEIFKNRKDALEYVIKCYEEEIQSILNIIKEVRTVKEKIK
jgi:hypothetical protein